MKLIDGDIGRDYTITDIRLEENVKRRLEMLGMTHNSRLSVMNRKGSGSFIIKVRGTRFAIGREFAEGIIVTEAQ